MRVLVVTHLFPSSAEPSYGIFNLRHLSALAQHCQVRVIATRPWRPGRARPPRHEIVGGLPVRHLTYFTPPRVGRSLHSLLLLPPLARAVAEEARRFPPEALLATWAFPDVVSAAALARRRGWPLVAKVHGSDVNVHLSHPLFRAQIRRACRQAHRVIAVSHALKGRLVEAGVQAERVLVQHNGVDAHLFRPRDRESARRELDLPRQTPVVLYVGSLRPEKGVRWLIECQSLLRREFSASVRTCLVGDGPLREQLLARVRELGLEDRVRLAGRRPPHEIPIWLAAADLLCLPSLREGCPNVVLEALASGRPVVASNVGGVPELVDDSRGVLVPPGDAGALAAALVETLGRTWCPETLRASVAHLSWERSAAVLLAELRGAREAASAGLL